MLTELDDPVQDITHKAYCDCHQPTVVVGSRQHCTQKMLLLHSPRSHRRPKVTRTPEGLWSRDGVLYSTWKQAVESTR